VQIAKSFGAEVTGVCSTAKVHLVRYVGADHVIDYAQEDFAQSGQQYDLILVMGGNRSLSRLVGHLRPLTSEPNQADLQFLTELIEAGKITPVIDKTLPLSEVPDAIRYLHEGNARGKVVITV